MTTHHMVIAKFQRFGITTSTTPLELYWPKSKKEYRASVVILKVAEYTDSFNQLCLRATGDIIASLKNVHSSCIIPITPSMESVENQSGGIITHAVMQVSDLDVAFGALSKIKTQPRAKNEINLEPIKVDSETPFVSTANTEQRNLLICNICVTPMEIGKSNMTDGDINKSLRNHAASHQLHTPFSEEPCGLCCKPHCHLGINITSQLRSSIEERSGILPPNATVEHNCKTYIDLEPFPFKFCNKTK